MRRSVEAILAEAHELRIVSARPTDLPAMRGPGEGRKSGARKRVTDAMAAEWSRLNREGLLLKDIAARAGFHVSTVQESVAAWRKAKRRAA